MQLTDLLSAAKNLDLQEQIELATQLLLWIEVQLNQDKQQTAPELNQSTGEVPIAVPEGN